MTTFGEMQGTATIRLPDSGPGFEVAWAAATDVGHRRAVNEDSLVVVPPVFAVADGMGGHSAGDIASAAVANRLASVGASGEATPAALERALLDAQADLLDLQTQSLRGSGTTVTGVAAVQAEGHASWLTFNIGDSRVYILGSEGLLQVTRDHSVVQEMVSAGLITLEQAQSHPDSNIITRAVGFEDSPVPDYGVVPMTAGQRVLVCSDGLSREVPDEVLTRILSSDDPVAVRASRLVTEALDRGGRDNITAVLIQVDGAL